jgi:hypothetical protein
MNADMKTRVLAETVWYFVGLDLGQSRDHSALAVVERAELILDEIDHVTYERLKERRYRVRYLERVALGTPYPNVVERVRAVVRAKPLVGQCTLVMDATGVGAPVLDLLRLAQLGCKIEPVILTGGEWESRAEGVWCVPKQDLVAGFRVMLEKRELGLPAKLGASRLLVKELAEMESWMGGRGGLKFGARREGAHDDLVMASALACWRARRGAPGMWGTKSLGLSH